MFTEKNRNHPKTKQENDKIMAKQGAELGSLKEILKGVFYDA
jgi:hypothetical protein